MTTDSEGSMNQSHVLGSLCALCVSAMRCSQSPASPGLPPVIVHDNSGPGLRFGESSAFVVIWQKQSIPYQAFQLLARHSGYSLASGWLWHIRACAHAPSARCPDLAHTAAGSHTGASADRFPCASSHRHPDPNTERSGAPLWLIGGGGRYAQQPRAGGRQSALNHALPCAVRAVQQYRPC